MAERCSARSKRTGERCGSWAMRGGTVCRMHGGATVRARDAARRRLLMAEVEAEARRLQLEGPQQRVGTPQDAADALLSVADDEMWLVRVLRGRVRALEEIRWRGDSEQTRAEVTAYEAALGRATTTLSSILRLDIEAWRAQLDADTGRLVVGCITKSLRAAGLEGLALERAQREAHRLLRLAWTGEQQEQRPELPPGQS